MGRKIALTLLMALALGCCRQAGPAYIVQVSLGGWDSPEYTAEQIIGRLDTVMRHGFDGSVLSWNIMEAPVNHIECLSETK